MAKHVLAGDISLADLCLISNDNNRACKTCGEVHAFISTKGLDGAGACGTPAVFVRREWGDDKGPKGWGVRVPVQPGNR